MFRSPNPIAKAIEECLKYIKPRVIVEMNEDLQKKFTRDEVEAALKQMAPLKSPSTNGYNAYISSFRAIKVPLYLGG